LCKFQKEWFFSHRPAAEGLSIAVFETKMLVRRGKDGLIKNLFNLPPFLSLQIIKHSFQCKNALAIAMLDQIPPGPQEKNK
jgi:hypothetical protein